MMDEFVNCVPGCDALVCVVMALVCLDAAGLTMSDFNEVRCSKSEI